MTNILTAKRCRNKGMSFTRWHDLGERLNAKAERFSRFDKIKSEIEIPKSEIIPIFAAR